MSGAGVGPVLLAVLAHPDDEVFRCGGSPALLSRRGVRVQVVCATRGESGSCGDPPLCSREELPALREQELRCSCAALGLEPPLLLQYRDGELGTVRMGGAVEQVMTAVRALHPEVLLSWPPDGLSGHPDHMAVSRWAALAFEQAGALGVAALYHLAVPRSLAKVLGMAQLQAIPDEDVTLAVDVMGVWEQKMAAIRCHRTQAGGSPILVAPEARQRLFLGKEHFRRAAARSEHDVMLDLLQGQ